MSQYPPHELQSRAPTLQEQEELYRLLFPEPQTQQDDAGHEALPGAVPNLFMPASQYVHADVPPYATYEETQQSTGSGLYDEAYGPMSCANPGSANYYEDIWAGPSSGVGMGPGIGGVQAPYDADVQNYDGEDVAVYPGQIQQYASQQDDVGRAISYQDTEAMEAADVQETTVVATQTAPQAETSSASRASRLGHCSYRYPRWSDLDAPNAACPTRYPVEGGSCRSRTMDLSRHMTEHARQERDLARRGCRLGSLSLLSGSRPAKDFFCNNCSRYFSRSYNLKKHTEVCTAENPRDASEWEGYIERGMYGGIAGRQVYSGLFTRL